jgi:hypothetical protein
MAHSFKTIGKATDEVGNQTFDALPTELRREHKASVDGIRTHDRRVM